MKKALSLLLALILALSLVLPAAAFDDVPEEAWYARPVNLAAQLGMIRGRSETQFVPNADIKLSEAIKLAAVIRRRWMGGSPLEETGSPWYQVYLDFALEHGILESAPADPNLPATRLDVARLFAAAVPEIEYPAINRVDDGAIPDIPDDPDVYLLYRAGVLTGGDDGSFRPSDPIRRSEVAAMVVRVLIGAERVHFSLISPGRTVTVNESKLADGVFAMVNDVRAAAGLSPLYHDPKLDEAADKRAAELEQRFSHTRPDGSSCFSVLDELKISCTSAGENIASGYIDAESVMEGWMNSEGHRNNIMGDYGRLAVGCHVGADGVVYWVQLFANE